MREVERQNDVDGVPVGAQAMAVSQHLTSMGFNIHRHTLRQFHLRPDVGALSRQDRIVRLHNSCKLTKTIHALICIQSTIITMQ